MITVVSEGVGGFSGDVITVVSEGVGGLTLGLGVIVSPDPVSQTLPSGSVAIPLAIVVPFPKVNTPFAYLTSTPCQPATLPDGDGFV